MERNTALLCLAAAWLLSCSHGGGEHGRPETLNPILGGGGLAIRAPATEPNEPVEDYSADLGGFMPAWPQVRHQLPRLVKAIIARGSWKDEHHIVAVMDGVLRVRHRPAVVAQVRKLMEELKARLLPPIDIHVAFVELSPAALSKVFSRDGKRPEGSWKAPAFRREVKQGAARSLARVMLSTHNGRWAMSDRVSNQAFVSGVTVADGSLTPRATTLASGFTIQAAAWRWGAERAVLAVTGSYTGGYAKGGLSISQKVHRELPRTKKGEHTWEAHDVKLDLPVREMLEFQNQFSLMRGKWTLAALLPRDQERICAMVVKVDWRSQIPHQTRVQTLSESGYLLDVIPIALPTDTRPYKVDKVNEIDNRREISANAVSWFKQRAKNYQSVQKRNTFNFQDESGNLTLNPAVKQGLLIRSTFQQQSRGPRAAVARSSQSMTSAPAGLMPAPLERLRYEVMNGNWPAGTALEFVANHVFVVHTKAMTKKVRALLEQTHAWRNRRVLIDLAFVAFGALKVDALEGAVLKQDQAAAIRKEGATLPAAFLLARGGNWGEFFVGEMHSVVSDAWAPDRSSPPVHVFWKGARLAIQPHLSADKVQRMDLRFKQHRLRQVAPQRLAGTVLQQPIDSLWVHNRPIHLEAGTSVLTGLHGEEEKLRALLLTTFTR